MSERIFIILMCCGAGLYLFFGLQIRAPFAYDPLGPGAFPLILSGTLIALCIFRFAMASGKIIHSAPNTIRVIGVMLAYLLVFKFLGFMLATTIAGYALARLVGATWMEGALTGLAAAIVFYGVFYFMLGVGLPLGAIYRFFG